MLEDRLKKKKKKGKDGNGFPAKEMVCMLGNHTEFDILEFKVISENGR